MSQTHCIGESETEHIWKPDKAHGGWITSFECGKNVRYEIHDYKSPIRYDIMTGAGHLRTLEVSGEMNDHVSEVIMRTYDQWKQGSATVWVDSNCRGPSAEF